MTLGLLELGLTEAPALTAVQAEVVPDSTTKALGVRVTGRRVERLESLLEPKSGSEHGPDLKVRFAVRS